MKNKDGKLLFGEGGILMRWAAYIQGLCSHERPDILIEAGSMHNTVSISEMEIKQTVVNLPKGNLLE